MIFIVMCVLVATSRKILKIVREKVSSKIKIIHKVDTLRILGDA